MPKLDHIARFPIQWINWAYLALILIATPYVASTQIGGLRIVATRSAQYFALGGFSLGVVFNLLGAGFFFCGKAKLRQLCSKWCFIHAAFLVVTLLVLAGYVRFDWLRDWLNTVGSWIGL